MHIPPRARGLLLACLTLWLTSCASTPPRIETVTVHEPVIVPVPAPFTQPVPVPMLPKGALTNGMLVSYIVALRAALALANQQLQRIRALPAPEPAR